MKTSKFAVVDNSRVVYDKVPDPRFLKKGRALKYLHTYRYLPTYITIKIQTNWFQALSPSPQQPR